MEIRSVSNRDLKAIFQFSQLLYFICWLSITSCRNSNRPLLSQPADPWHTWCQPRSVLVHVAVLYTGHTSAAGVHAWWSCHQCLWCSSHKKHCIQNSPKALGVKCQMIYKTCKTISIRYLNFFQKFINSYDEILKYTSGTSQSLT